MKKSENLVATLNGDLLDFMCDQYCSLCADTKVCRR